MEIVRNTFSINLSFFTLPTLGCVYAAGADGFVPDKETTRQQAAGLFGCADTGANKINGLDLFEDGHGVCLSNGNGMSTEINITY